MAFHPPSRVLPPSLRASQSARKIPGNEPRKLSNGWSLIPFAPQKNWVMTSEALMIWSVNRIL